MQASGGGLFSLGHEPVHSASVDVALCVDRVVRPARVDQACVVVGTDAAVEGGVGHAHLRDAVLRGDAVRARAGPK